MARHRQHVRAEEPELKGPGFITSFVRFFETVAILLVIAYVAALLISRTDGFRSLLADRLEDIAGMPVKIQRSRAQMNLDIVLTGLATENDGRQSSPGLRARRVLLDWSPADALRRMKIKLRGAEIDDAEITFATTVSGQWEPAPLAPLSEQIAKWLGMDLRKYVKSDAAPVAAGARTPGHEKAPPSLGSTRLRVRGTKVGWWSDETNEIARLDGLSLDVTPVETPGRHLTHYLVKLDRASSTSGFDMRNVNIELVDATDQQVVLGFQADGGKSASQGAPEAGRN